MAFLGNAWCSITRTITLVRSPNGVLPLYYPINDQQRAVIDRYSRRLHDQICRGDY